MLAILDLLPVVIFFAAYRLYGIYEATLALIVAMVLIIATHWFVKGTVSRMLLVSGAFAVVLGGITIWFENPVFLQWKPTIVYWIFGIVLLAVDLVSPRNIFERTLGETVEVSRSAWRVLNHVWVVIFVAMGVINIFVAYNYDMDTWVQFKLYLAIASVILGFVVTAGFLYFFMPAEEEAAADEAVVESTIDGDNQAP
ncbi:MAG: inner membrane-spanning protein YciB [Gammaproteobacteria bacterium]